MSEKTGLIFFPAFDWCISPTHPERQERLLYTKDQLTEEGIFDLPQIKELRPQMANLKDIARTHACFPDINSNLTDGHLAACGSTLALADALIQNEIKNGFALVRPPGHHAMHVVHGNRGFCNINNEAIMIDYLRSKYGIKKIAVIDTDVHHGDGTQDIFYNDPNVLFISIHQDGRTLYPGTGFVDEYGGPNAKGYNLNFPLPPGTGDEGFLYVLEKAILPILDSFKPEIIVNSAGQDNHFSDPLSRMQMTARGYAKLNQILKPHIAVLEGGYSVEGALPYVNMAIILAMAGMDYSQIIEPECNLMPMTQDMKKEIAAICDHNLKIWQCREDLKVNSYKKEGHWYVRKRGIFYDTDGLREKQTEKISECNECSGLRIIATEVDKGYKEYSGLVVAVPFDTCPCCRSKAGEIFNESKKAPYDAVYLQDKTYDKFTYYYPRQNREDIIT